MRSAELAIIPSRDVVAENGCWSHGGLHVSIAAPPEVIGRDSSEDEISRAQAALTVGLAETRSRGPFLPGEFALPVSPSIAVAVSGNPLAFLASGTCAFLRIHWLPTILGCLAVLAGLFGHSPVVFHGAVCLLMLLGSLVIHEFGHALAFIACARAVEARAAAAGAAAGAGPSEAAVLVVCRDSPHLVHSTRDRKSKIVVTLAGPFSPLVVALVFAPILVQALPELCAALVIAVSHILTLALPTGDGGELRRDLSRVGNLG